MNVDMDACALLLNAEGMVASDQDFVFFNNLQSPDGSVEHTGDRTGEGHIEEITVNLVAIPAAVERIVFTLSIYDAETRLQSFGFLHSQIRVLNQADGQEIARYNLAADPGASNTAIVFGELYRHGTTWDFQAIGKGTPLGLRSIAQSFGVNV
ncbi:tellurium resistance protein TerD [Streptomyces sp. V4I2]|nr:tellurium resistance protein TerD [Streptomyces sp. V4I2]